MREVLRRCRENRSSNKVMRVVLKRCHGRDVGMFSNVSVLGSCVPERAFGLVAPIRFFQTVLEGEGSYLRRIAIVYLIAAW